MASEQADNGICPYFGTASRSFPLLHSTKVVSGWLSEDHSKQFRMVVVGTIVEQRMPRTLQRYVRRLCKIAAATIIIVIPLVLWLKLTRGVKSIEVVNSSATPPVTGNREERERDIRNKGTLLAKQEWHFTTPAYKK